MFVTPPPNIEHDRGSRRPDINIKGAKNICKDIKLYNVFVVIKVS